MDINAAIQYAQLVNTAYAIPTNDLTNSAGQVKQSNYGGAVVSYDVVTTIYANDLSTDMNPHRDDDIVSIGLILQAQGAGDVVIAIRGTEGILEWIHDAEFLAVRCPFLAGAGSTEDGFTAMYNSFGIGVAAGSPSVTEAFSTITFPRPITSVTICGHSLGAALATFLALDVAANTPFKNPVAYTYASPRTGDTSFVKVYSRLVPNTFRIANVVDLVPKLPTPPLYEHVQGLFTLNPIKLFPPSVLVKPTIPCDHVLNSYLHLLSRLTGGAVLP